MIRIAQYHDWWFDNAVEFLGYLLERLDIGVVWNEGISFEPLNKDEVERLVEKIERLISFKLKYQTKDENTERIVEKNRAYLPTMHRGKYVNFLGKSKEAKNKILTLLLCSKNNFSGKKRCDICSRFYDDAFNISQAAQIVYPVVTGSLKSQCGIRKMESEYHCCALCAFLGSIEWLDDIPFACDHANFTHYLLFPKIEGIKELHIFKNELRGVLNQNPYSNVISISVGAHGDERETYSKDEYSLLLSLLERIWTKIEQIEEYESILCDRWIRLKIKGMEATYQTKYSYLEEIHIPHIERFNKIFEELLPYSDFVSASFASPLKESASREIIQKLTREGQYLMSKGIIMDDFKTFSKAFQVRQNCRLSTPKDALDYLIYTWRCEDG